VADQLIPVGTNFWNIRGSFKTAGIIDIGTQASLVKRAAGDFVLLDSYTLTGAVEREVMDLTDGGQAVSAVINLHPFHTIHVKRTAAQFPAAKLYGSARHVAKAPDLAWESTKVEDDGFAALFADDLAFSIPRGVDFISPDPNLHFSSVLAFHPASKTLHVDDTLMWISIPGLRGIAFHPTLKRTLERCAGAAADFRAWARDLVTQCQGYENLCAAHMKAPAPRPLDIAGGVRKALGKVEKVLAAHEKRFG